MERLRLNRSDILLINGRHIKGYRFGSFQMFGSGGKVSITLFRFDRKTETYDPEKTSILILGSVERFTPEIYPDKLVKISRLPQARWRIIHFKPHYIQNQEPATGKN